MGNHRAERHGSRRQPSGTPRRSTTRVDTGANAPLTATPSVADDATTVFRDHDATVEIPLVRAQPGKRRAVKQPRPRRPRLGSFPSAPVLLGTAALAVAVGGGVVTATEPALVLEEPKVQQASALVGSSASGSVGTFDRGASLSRDSRRDALADTAEAELVAEAAAQMRQRNTALAQFAKDAEARAQEIAENQWVLPLAAYRLTARFGDYGLWANYHTGLDFAAPTGTPLVAMANAVITSAGWEGAYGYKTVLTLEDGTELWYAHQDSISVSTGDVVRAGEVVGTVGSTGNVTGPHLHLEVRPGAGDPVDPYTALMVRGLQP